MKVTFTVPDDLHRAVKAAAARRGDTVTKVIVDACRRYLNEDDGQTRLRRALDRAERYREAQPGEWHGDVAQLIEQGREERSRQIEDALGSR